MECLLCSSKNIKGNARICEDCVNKKHERICKECGSVSLVGAYYFIRKIASECLCKNCNGKGIRNNNFGKKWSEENKLKQSELVKSKVDDAYRERCSKSMKGKSVSEDTKSKRKDTMLKRYGTLYTPRTISEEQRQLIGEKSKKKFTEQFKQKIRVANEKRGIWIPLDVKDDYLFYRSVADWKSLVISSSIIGIEKLKSSSFYSKTNANKDSLVRDHMYGRINGFNNGVFPELIRHPANCQLISHSENIKKSREGADSVISLDKLFERIENWKDEFESHEACISLIKAYREGKRYRKEIYIKTYYELKN